MELFDKNGNATETHVVKVSGYDPDTRELVSTYEVRILAGTGIPGFSTLILAPTAEAGHAVCWSGTDWKQITDLREKTAYLKDSGAPFVIKTLGELDDAYTLLKPSTPYDKWDGNQWVTDVEAQHTADVAAAAQTKTALRAAADDEIDWLQDAVDSGIATDEEITLLAAWKAYRVQLMRIKTDAAPYIVWPTPPAQA